MLETVLTYLRTVDPVWIYLTVIFFAFIENLFPPAPSDVVVIVGASLLAASVWGCLPVVLLTSLASALGFMVMYFLGRYLGEKMARKGKPGWIPLEALAKSERWFERYGYWFVAANRFLPGTRSAISFASGVLDAEPRRTFGCALLSALLWNSMIIYLGMLLGANVCLIDRYLSAYHRVIILVTAAAVAVLLIRWLVKRKRGAGAGEPGSPAG
ncbi:MAG: DedA family protein [Candidatus Erginobacter occultus]|nr:DedA family protein [Candidatus Erginobacter occultus]